MRKERKREKQCWFTWFALGGLLSAPAVADAAVWYVNASQTSGADNGAGWPNAFHNTVAGRTPLQRALDASQSGDEVWVAAGTYKPTSGLNRVEAFFLKQGVKLRGGFEGCETSETARRAGRFTTILSGDLLGNDGAVPTVIPGSPGNAPKFANYSDNSCHVVVARGTTADLARLDGFTIRGGNATSDAEENVDCSAGENVDGGGALLIDLDQGGVGGSLTVRGCTMIYNQAGQNGGAVYSPSHLEGVSRSVRLAAISRWATAAP